MLEEDKKWVVLTVLVVVLIVLVVLHPSSRTVSLSLLAMTVLGLVVELASRISRVRPPSPPPLDPDVFKPAVPINTEWHPIRESYPPGTLQLWSHRLSYPSPSIIEIHHLPEFLDFVKILFPRASARIRFDLGQGLLSGLNVPDEPASTEISFEKIVAFQLISKFVYLEDSHRSNVGFELNVILKDGSRVNIADCTSMESIGTMARVLAKSLNKVVYLFSAEVNPSDLVGV